MSGPADMGSHHDIWMTKQAMLASTIAVAHHVQGGSCQSSRGEG